MPNLPLKMSLLDTSWKFCHLSTFLPLWTFYWKVHNNKIIYDYQEKCLVSIELAIVDILQFGVFIEISYMPRFMYIILFQIKKLIFTWQDWKWERISSIFLKKSGNLRIQTMSLKSWIWISTNKPEVITIKQSISF